VYRDGVRTVLDRLRDGRLEKVVLARSLELTANEPIDRLLMLKRLAARDPHAYTYAVNLGGRTLIGASPELLVSVRDGIVATNPLAGSAPRDPDPERDALNAAALSTSAKDLHEHTFVVTAIRDALAPLCRELTIPSTPALLTTATMWHLSSRISGRAREGVTALDIALALHPTPAVCGVPADLAYEVIKELEPFDRGFYAGMVGWTDARGDGDWVVTIRCGEVDSKHVRLFAGAGIVPASTPDAELAETEAKLQTLLLTIGAVEARDVA
jgi:isochorismate synthase